MNNAGSSTTQPNPSPYTTGRNYGRYLRGYEWRYGLPPLSNEEAQAHAGQMADSGSEEALTEFVRGLLDGYALEGRQAQANGG